MRKLIVLPSIALALLWVAAPSLAQTKSQTKAPMVRHLTGTVASVDDQAKTLVVTRVVRGKSHEYTFTAEKDAAGTLASLKTGERVTVSYVGTGGHMTAEKIVQAGQASKK